MLSRPVWTALGLCTGAAFLWLAFRFVDVDLSLAIAQEAKFGYALLAVFTAVAFMIVKAWRWAVMLSPVGRFKTRQLLGAVCAGTALNLLISHAGEVARAMIVNKRAQIGTSYLLGTIALERVFDVAAVLLFVGLLALNIQTLPELVLTASYIASGLVMLAVTLICVGMLWRSTWLRCAGYLASFLPDKLHRKLVWHLEHSLRGLEAARNARLMPQLIALSILQWSCIVVAIFASTRALGLTPDAFSAIAVLALLVIGLMLPNPPVHVGTTQLGFILGLAAFDVAPANAFAASVIYTLFVLVPMMVLGLMALYRSGLRWSALTEER